MGTGERTNEREVCVSFIFLVLLCVCCSNDIFRVRAQSRAVRLEDSIMDYALQNVHLKIFLKRDALKCN